MARRGTRSWLHMVLYPAVIAVTIYAVLDLECPRFGLIRLDAADVNPLRSWSAMRSRMARMLHSEMFSGDVPIHMLLAGDFGSGSVWGCNGGRSVFTRPRPGGNFCPFGGTTQTM